MEGIGEDMSTHGTWEYVETKGRNLPPEYRNSAPDAITVTVEPNKSKQKERPNGPTSKHHSTKFYRYRGGTYTHDQIIAMQKKKMTNSKLTRIYIIFLEQFY